jgi:hypothetical protein
MHVDVGDEKYLLRLITDQDSANVEALFGR